ncbi:MAG: guanylate kinase [Tissierellia bacterium]|nr:guanylate kinase [Tissierellia bacterium]
MSRGFLLVLSGPSGAGKGTVSKELIQRNEDIVFSISATTRDKRPGEQDGVNYYFMDEETFDAKANAGEFLEYAHVHNDKYATPKEFVMNKVAEGEIVLLEIDVQGALQIKKNYKNAVFMFLLPPSMTELKRRIEGRQTETEEEIELRYSNAFKELDFVNEYDYFVVNDTVEQAVLDMEAIIRAEKHRVKRFKYIKERVIGEKNV